MLDFPEVPKASVQPSANFATALDRVIPLAVIERRVHRPGDHHNIVDELRSIFEKGFSLKIQIDELPLAEFELKKDSCRKKASKTRDSEFHRFRC
ncbi:hypothetical protein KIW84_022026 [Lathyrus oleraceus]|uniref:Uncharacterized protein n=1 Tax=Pisum sativum TaxID=3888 RepID=A0A9D4YA44_PEA|nr:hypothetical protein KIW84_022026 [Pisum sativum]